MKIRKISGDPKKVSISGDDHAPPPLVVRERRHVYRVGGLRIPVQNPDLIQSPRSRFARKYKEILRKTAKAKKPEERFDPDSIEPPIHLRSMVSRRSPPPFRREHSIDSDKDTEDEGDNP